MYGIIFALFSLALLLFYGMTHTFIFVRKMKRDFECKKTYVRYGRFLGATGCVSLILAILLYYFGVG
ncbi:hypothetical protein BKP35_11285 [Anaerobacillus arseniciselenatis]|uniref:Uncharacterized protein n=1 Tax=Anaerobacillus arseniciselenatis TaxID=85682 RepID=A0A1S2LHT6_9BACI|nr:hypothetical protein BKP35_11285 [Anaerobacillus arseniciselenatis]